MKPLNYFNVLRSVCGKGWTYKYKNGEYKGKRNGKGLISLVNKNKTKEIKRGGGLFSKITLLRLVPIFVFVSVVLSFLAFISNSNF